MSNLSIPVSELILNPDESVYHLHLRDEHIADIVILVGDQDRVPMVSRYFDKVEPEIRNREFLTHTGIYNGKRITVLSSGIGTDNIDIVLNELDAAVNIDPIARKPKDKLRTLQIIRIGTSGALQADIPVGSFVISTHGIGFDGLIYFYNQAPSLEEIALSELFHQHLSLDNWQAKPYVTVGSECLLNLIGYDMYKGITASASGFYGPQGRQLRLLVSHPDLNYLLSSFSYNHLRVTNFEMETSALYGLGKLLGHECITCCAIIANRSTKDYCEDHESIIDALIKKVLDRISSNQAP